MSLPDRLWAIWQEDFDKQGNRQPFVPPGPQPSQERERSEQDGGIILYVEDNFENLLLVTRVLEAEGYVVVGASDAQSGLQLARNHQPDLILVDINMPEIDGLTLTTMIKGEPGLGETPVLALTANVMQGDMERSFSAGCDGYIHKPIDVDSLPGQIRRHLNHHCGEK